MLARIITTALFVFFCLAASVYADAPALSTQEQFAIISPQSDEKFTSSVKISFLASDSDLAQIPYAIDLLDSKCSSVVGNVVQGELASGTVGEVVWNLVLPSTSRQINTGDHCIRVCVSLKLGGQPANVCGRRSFSLTESVASSLKFTKVPVGDVLVENASWRFKLAASRIASFDLKVAPDFLQLDRGELSLRSLRDGIYEVLIEANAEGIVTFAQFRLHVNTKASFVSGSDSANISDIVFLSPGGNTVFSGSNNLIKLAIGDEDGLRELVVEYSANGQNWTNIKSLNLDARTSVEISENFDVSAIPSGKYYIRARVTDSAGSLTEKLATQVTIVGKSASDAQSSVPLIINIQPADTSTVSEFRPLISGGLVPTFGASIDPKTFKIRLDGADISNQCRVLTTKFECSLGNDLLLGRHQINVEVTDTLGQNAKREWVFNVREQSSTVSQPVEQTTELPRGVIIVAIIVCCLTLLFILIPWLLYFIWRARTTSKSTKITPSPIQPIEEVIVDIPYFSPSPVVAVPAAVAEPAITENPPVQLVSSEPPLITATPLQPATKVDPAADSVPDWLKEKSPTPLTSIPSDQLGSFGYGQKADK